MRIGLKGSSGWPQRAPDLDILSSGYVLRSSSGSQIAEKGSEFLVMMEAHLDEAALSPAAISPPVLDRPDLPSNNVVQLVDYQIQHRRRRVAA